MRPGNARGDREPGDTGSRPEPRGRAIETSQDLGDVRTAPSGLSTRAAAVWRPPAWVRRRSTTVAAACRYSDYARAAPRGRLGYDWVDRCAALGPGLPPACRVVMGHRRARGGQCTIGPGGFWRATK